MSWSFGRQMALDGALATPTVNGVRGVLQWIDAVEDHARSGSQKELPRLSARGRLDVVGARRAAEVAELLLETGGKGIHDALERLLAHVAVCSEEELVRFWARVMAPRHAFGRKDTTATLRAELGSLALLSLSARGSVAARDAMLNVLPALGAADRGELLFQAALCGRLGDDLPAGAHGNWIEVVRRAAIDDASFEARYLARCALRLAEAEVPAAGGGSYGFELRVGTFSCVIEVSASARLDDLHVAIQRALKWDDDHLWCFHLNGDRRDWRFTWPMEEWLERWMPPSALTDDDPAEDADPTEDEDDPVHPQPETIGQLGLRVGDRVLYHFDFGDDHLLKLKVVRVDERRPRGTKRPAIVNVKGEPPEQYPS